MLKASSEAIVHIWTTGPQAIGDKFEVEMDEINLHNRYASS